MDTARKHHRPLNIAYVVGGLYTEASGIACAVAWLSRCLAELGHSVTVFVPSYRNRPVIQSLLSPEVKLVSTRGYWFFRLGVSPELKRKLFEQLSLFDVVHTHSLWMLPTHYATMAARKHGVASVASIHGFLDPWALRRSRLKKLLASVAFQRWDLKNSSFIHALGSAEVDVVRRFVNVKKFVVIPNGVPPDVTKHNGDKVRFFTRVPFLRDHHIMLFMSRIHFKKGLDLLVNAWAQLRGRLAQWRLVIIGPDDGYEKQLRRLILDLELADQVQVLPPCYGRDKWDALAAADCFVLPSRSEGLPMALLEAMGAGLPVIYTTGCYFPEAARRQAGYEVICEVSKLADAIVKMTALPPEVRRDMGRRGGDLIRQKFLWPRIARQFAEFYQWLAAGQVSEPPDCVLSFESR